MNAAQHRLNLGCGPHYAHGWTNIDRWSAEEVNDGRSVDLVADLAELPFADNSCSRVYMGHVIEHLSLPHGVYAALKEVRRVLAPDGELMVVGPDVERAREGWPNMVEAIVPHPATDALMQEGLPHLWAPTERVALGACRRVFSLCEPLPVATISHEWPLVDPVGWQFAISCVVGL